MYTQLRKKYCCFCLACIDDIESTNECQNQINNFFKPWKQKELRPLPPFGNVIDVEMDSEVVVIDNDYNHISDMVREGDVFAILALDNNP